MKIFTAIVIVAILIIPMTSFSQGYIYPVIYGDAVFGNGADSLYFNYDFNIDIMFNPEGYLRTGWSSPFELSGTGDVTQLSKEPWIEDHYNMGSFPTWMYDSWDQVLPDQFNYSAAFLTPLGGSEPLTILTIHELNVVGGQFLSGQFCIDSGDFADDTYDWLFDPEVPFNGPYCWDVVSDSPPPDDTLEIWPNLSGPAVWGDSINVNETFYVDMAYSNGEFARTSWSSPLTFYGTGDVLDLANQAALMATNFQALCTETFEHYGESWDGVLPDKYCVFCEGLIPNDGASWYFARFAFQIAGDETTFGEFCVEKGNMTDDNYDWLFERPVPDFETYCWTVKQRTSTGLCGDANDDGDINVLDIVYLISYLYVGGPEPYNIRQADVNNDCMINILDVLRHIDFLYSFGDPLLCPEVWPCE